MKLGTPIAMGNTAKIYLHKNRVVKVLNDDLPESISTYEADKQKYAYSCGLSVPQVLDVTKIDGKQVIIMEYVKGSTIGDLLAGRMEHVQKYISLSIDVQLKIHRVPAGRIERMDEKLSRQIGSTHYLDERQKSTLLEKLTMMTFEKKLCHGDFHLNNLILSKGKVSIIDWVDASAGDVRADVYRTFLLYSQFSSELADMYLHQYCEKSGFSREEIVNWAPIIAGARLAENASSENPERLTAIVNGY